MNRLILDIAGLKLKLDVSNIDWRDLLKRKFSNFLAKEQTGKTDMKIIINFIGSRRLKDTRFLYINAKTTKIFFPNSLRHFQALNYAVKNTLSAALLRNSGCLLHASSAELNKKAVMFVGTSGQGKSTTVKVLGAKILADDRSIIRWRKKQPIVYGSPFYERLPFTKSKTAFPAVAIFLLNKRRISKFRADKLSPREAIFHLIPHVVIREEEPEKEKTVQLKLAIKACQLLAETVPIYKLYRPLSLRGENLRRSLNEIIA